VKFMSQSMLLAS